MPREVLPSARKQEEDRNIDSERLATVEGFPSRGGKRKRRPAAQVPRRRANNQWERRRHTECRTVPRGGRGLALCGGRRERRLTSLSNTTPFSPPQRGGDLRRPTPLLSEEGKRGGALEQTLVLLFLAFDAMPRPGNRFQAFYLNLALTGDAQAISAVLEAVQGFVD